jgi:hypothetical protein
MSIEVSLSRYSDINEDIVRQWADLEWRAVDGNPYLSPYFVLPGIKYLTRNNKPIFLTVKNKISNVNKLVGFGVFEYSIGTRHFPLPHLKAYRTPHSYLGGLLIDDEYMQTSLDAIFDYIKKSKSIFGVEFINRVDNTELSRKIILSINKYNMQPCLDQRKSRAILIPNKITGNYIETHFSGKYRKSLQRQYRLLYKFGDVRWNVVYGRQVDDRVVDQFLRLEHMGWKGEERTSLLSNPNNEKFFREMIGAFSKDDRVFFTELSVNSEVIASTSNLISSKMGYAFKIGWDPKFAQVSPGILNEYELIKEVAKLFPNLECIDSGANEGSFIEKLWHDHYIVISEIIATKYIAKKVMGFFNYLRKIKDK